MSATQRASLPWLIIISGSLIAILSIGPRSAMGFFQLPLLTETGWDRGTFGLAMAIQNLSWGLGQPLFGAIADKYGTGRVLVMSGLFYAAGLFLMSLGESPVLLHIGGGVLVGLGVAAGSFGIILSAFARNVTPEQRSFAFGIGTAAGSAGMFLFAPISQALIANVGWSDGLVWIGAMTLIIPVLAWALRGNAQSGTQKVADSNQTASQALVEAFGHKSYILLTLGFFVCGFQVAFITAHFPAYLNDLGIFSPWPVIAMALIGFFNIIGSLGAGYLGQKYSKRYILAFIYFGRSVAVTAFLLLPQNPVSVVIFSAVMGVLWLSTVPPTNALVAIMFGTRHLGLLGGLVFLSHQVGSFLGVWLGGVLYDTLGSYDLVWWFGVIMGIAAGIVHLPIRETGVARLQMKAA